MFRTIAIALLAAIGLFAATIRLYLKDGTYQVVREYEIKGDRVRYYSTERGEWEEIPVSLVDVKRTEAENQERTERQKKEAAELSAEEAAERAERDERDRIPVESGVYYLQGNDVKSLKQAESKVVSNKRRSLLKAVAPIPVVTGKSTVELDGEHSSTVLTNSRPDMYVRPSAEEHFMMVKLEPGKGTRVVQRWTLIPVTKEMVEEQNEVGIFRKQLADGLFKIWPMKPLEPGEYAIIQFTAGKGNVQTWDFAYRR